MEGESKKLRSLRRKQEQLKARIQVLESAEKARARKQDTRRKILIGAYYLDKAKRENNLSEIAQLIDGYLKRNTDRALFGLAPLLQKTPTTNE